MSPPTSTSKSSKRGAFIVIEGLDRSGKTTQASALVKRLKNAGVSVKLMKFPDRSTPIGKLIDAYLKNEVEVEDHVIHLLFSANRWELASSIVDTLNEGTTIVCDRYAFSGIAFSAAKVRPSTSSSSSTSTSTSTSQPTNPLTDNPPPPTSTTSTHNPAPPPILPYEWCRTPDHHLPAPDLTFFLDVSPTLASTRASYGSERYENTEMQERVREVFERLGGEVESSGVGRWVVLDADLERGEVGESVWREVSGLLGLREGEKGGEVPGVWGPVKKLWDSSREARMVDALYI